MQLTREHLNRDRPPGPIAQQPVDDLRRAALLIARVPQPGQLARAPLEIRGGHVVEHQFPSLEMPAGETIPHPPFAPQQPGPPRRHNLPIRGPPPPPNPPRPPPTPPYP